MNPRKNRKRENSKSRGVRIHKTAALLVLFCLCVGGISMVSARYIKQTEIKSKAVTADEFYFESDLLDGNTHEVVATNDENGTATASVTVRLKNYADELRYSGITIEYTLAVSPADGVQIQYGSNAVTSSEATHTLEKNKQSQEDITLSGLKPGKSYTVTATTQGNTYQKTLTGTIKVTAPDQSVYASLKDETQYIEVTVWTTDYSESVKLTYGNIGLLPDNTDAKLQNAVSSGSTITENNWRANTSHVFRFFKSDTNKSYQVTVDNESKEVTVSEKQQ